MMARFCRVLSVAKSGLKSEFSLNPSTSQRLFCNRPSNSNTLLTRLLREPKSSTKRVLDSDGVSALRGSDFSLEALVTGLRYSSFPEKAQLVLEWILEKMLNENERDHEQYAELISLCGSIQNVPLAMCAFTSMEALGITLTSFIFNSLIHACLASGNVIAAFSVFEIMESSEGYKPNSKTYNTFISAFANLGNVDAMQSWYSAKKVAGFSADLQTYESLILGCVRTKNFDLADRYYEEMMESGIKPNMPILENMLEGFCKRKSFGQVKEFLKFVLDGGWEVNEQMTKELVGLYFKRGKVEEMEELLVTLMDSNHGSEMLSWVHCGIIKMYAMADRLDNVEFSVGRMLKQGLSFKCADDFEKVICSYFRREAYDRLDLFLEHIKGSYKLTGSNYNLLVAGYRRAGLSEKLNLVIEDMKLAGFS